MNRNGLTWVNFVFTLFVILISNKSYAAAEIIQVTEKEILAPSQFSDDDAEILKKVVSIEVNEDFTEVVESYLAIKINSSNAIADYSQIVIPYDSYYEEVELLYANTIDQAGTRLALDQNAFQIQTPTSKYFYKDSRNLVFSVPSLKAGSVIEYQYRRSVKNARVPHYFGTSLYFYSWHRLQDARQFRFDAVRESNYTISYPQDMPMFFRPYNQDSIKRKYSKNERISSGIKTVEFSARDLPSQVIQGAMPHFETFLPYFLVSTIEDWEPIRSWALDLFETQRIITPAIREIAQKIESENTSKEEKLKAVYKYINENVRYIYSHVGRGGYTPHQPQDILGNGFGDCKDQTMLAVVLLNEMGIEAHPALINTNTKIIFDPLKYSPGFDHMFVYLPQPIGGVNWLDTSADNALFPGAISFADDRPALILRNSDQAFVHTPNRGTLDNSMDVVIELDGFGNSEIVSRFEIRFKGLFEERYRSIWNINTQEKRRELVESFIKNFYSNSTITKYQGFNENSLFEAFYITGEFEVANAWEGEGQPFVFGLSFPGVWRNIFAPTGFVRAEDRKVPLFFPTDYAFNATLKSAIPGDGYDLEVSSIGETKVTPYFYIDQSYESDDSGVTIQMKSDFYSGMVELADYQTWLTTYESFLNSPHWVLSYNYDSTNSALNNYKTDSNSSIEEVNKLIQLYIDSGEFSKAKDSAEEAINRQDVNAKSYYLLGLSQAYLGDTDSAESSFTTAEEMGYE